MNRIEKIHGHPGMESKLGVDKYHLIVDRELLPQLYNEPQPDQSRLLKGNDWETINRKAGVDIMDIVMNLDGRYSKSQQMDLISKRCDLTAKAQDAKTASIKDAERKEKVAELNDKWEKAYEKALDENDAEYQIEALIEEMKTKFNYLTNQGTYFEMHGLISDLDELKATHCKANPTSEVEG